MDLGLTGKTALVTGGSRGIGRATALALAQAGVQVNISYSSNEAAAQETVAMVEAAGGRCFATKFDVADAEANREAVEKIVKEQGGLHILVANAGVALDGLLMRFKDEDLDKTFKTNVFGAFYGARAASRPMMKARFGRIIFMSSVVGEMGNVGQTAYAGSKAALIGMAKSMAKELASRNITVNVVAPGFIETDMTSGMNEDMKKYLSDNIPLGGVGKPEQVADAVAFLASERAAYITGHVLDVNGGLYM